MRYAVLHAPPFWAHGRQRGERVVEVNRGSLGDTLEGQFVGLENLRTKFPKPKVCPGGPGGGPASTNNADWFDMPISLKCIVYYLLSMCHVCSVHVCSVHQEWVPVCMCH